VGGYDESTCRTVGWYAGGLAGIAAQLPRLGHGGRLVRSLMRSGAGAINVWNDLPGDLDHINRDVGIALVDTGAAAAFGKAAYVGTPYSFGKAAGNLGAAMCGRQKGG
jgi:hypothetical protein